jgi:hypothetical protein
MTHGKGIYHPHLTAEQESCLIGCSTPGYYADMRRHFEAGTCPFCLIDHSKNTVIFEHDRWLGWQVGGRFSTRTKTAIQLMFFPRVHGDWSELSREHWGDQHDIFQWVKNEYGHKGGGFAGRFGDMTYNVGTVPGHAHITYYLPLVPGEGTVLVPFGKDKDRLEADVLLMLEHKKQFESAAA